MCRHADRYSIVVTAVGQTEVLNGSTPCMAVFSRQDAFHTLYTGWLQCCWLLVAEETQARRPSHPSIRGRGTGGTGQNSLATVRSRNRAVYFDSRVDPTQRRSSYPSNFHGKLS
jgi:hypothetical protein